MFTQHAFFIFCKKAGTPSATAAAQPFAKDSISTHCQRLLYASGFLPVETGYEKQTVSFFASRQYWRSKRASTVFPFAPLFSANQKRPFLQLPCGVGGEIPAFHRVRRYRNTPYSTINYKTGASPIETPMPPHKVFPNPIPSSRGLSHNVYPIYG